LGCGKPRLVCRLITNLRLRFNTGSMTFAAFVCHAVMMGRVLPAC
jgi:hypothetical protein